MSDEVGAELAVGEGPDLDQTVPSGGDDDRDGLGRGKADAGDPLGVSLLGDGVLALSKGVPELDGLVTGSRDNLPVVSGEGNGEDVLGVTDETTGGASGVDLPKTEGSVPGSREGKLSIGGDDNIRDKVRVSPKCLPHETVVTLLAGKGPDKAGLITGRR